MSNINIQTTTPEVFSPNNIRFSIPESNTASDDKGFTYKKVNINIEYPDGTTGPLIVPTPKCFSFGVQENGKDSWAVRGWSMGIVMYKRELNGIYIPTYGRVTFMNTFEGIVERCKEYLLNNRESIEMYDLERDHLNRLASCMYRKKVTVVEAGKRVQRPAPNSNPILYVKLIKGADSFVSSFYEMEDVLSNEDGIEIDPMTLIGSYCNVRAAIKFESIFVSPNIISLQVKLYEANIQKIGGKTTKRLLKYTKVCPIDGYLDEVGSDDEDDDEDEDEDEDE